MDNGLKVGGVCVNERGLVILSFFMLFNQNKVKNVLKTIFNVFLNVYVRTQSFSISITNENQ